MNRRGFLKGLATLTAAPFLPKVLPLPPQSEAIQTRAFPQVFVYLNGVFQLEGLFYEVVPHKDRSYTVEFYEPVEDSSHIQIISYPSDDDHITLVSHIDRYGAQINERNLYYST